MSSAATQRRVLLLAHTGRDAARDVALAFCKSLTGHGLLVRLLEADAAELGLDAQAYDPPLEFVAAEDDAGADCELALVVGGDGSILRAAEVTRASGTPVLGVNLGHVGFLAEAEPEDVEATIEAVVGRTWIAEDRLTLDVRVFRDGELVNQTFALNEASIEKAARERMIEVVVEIDGRPLSRWGCDGVVLSTPTGSTAYNFSAGGPVVWPGVEALVVVPISAHALFARPLVVAPDSVVAVEVIARTDGAAVLWCDGRRAVDLPPGARIEVRRGPKPVRLARLHLAPFTDRLVAKFDLPVEGWRGSAQRRRRAEEQRSEAPHTAVPPWEEPDA
ncbi:NAD kinase [Nocardioides sp.]|uniref:NAD kinase n=1 Tax=Nocardioides sp. TaxID=35761 RepID=UPI00356458FF